MRKVVFGGANSLDNFFARKDGSYDWIIMSDEVAEIMKEQWPRYDTMVMGRKTYAVASGGEKPSKKSKKKNPYGDLKTYVFSRTLEPGEQDGVVITSEDPGKFVAKL